MTRDQLTGAIRPRTLLALLIAALCWSTALGQGVFPIQGGTGTLSISSSPSGARVLVDGQFVGETPLVYSTAAGERRIRVELDDFARFQANVDLEPGAELSINANLSRRSGTPDVTTNTNDRFSEPEVVSGGLFIRGALPGAPVFLDGERLGNVPGSSISTTFRDIAPGRYTLRVGAPGTPVYEEVIDIRPGRTLRLDAQQVSNTIIPRLLAQGQGAVTFSTSPRAAQIYINGNFLGITPTNPVPLDAGNYEVRFSLPGYRDQTVRFRVVAGTAQIISEDLQSR
ncbi:MAG: PEGA domain-containing protein [Trueperaceae bacterium]|nr:PEGA domain-containing protein [Trueperaceae bacterium]